MLKQVIYSILGINSIYVSIPISRFLPPPPLLSLGINTFVLYFCVSISVLQMRSSILLFCFPCGSASKESACNVGDLGSIPRLGRSPGEGKGYQLQYSGLENSMDHIVYGVSKSLTQLSNFHFHTIFLDSIYMC